MPQRRDTESNTPLDTNPGRRAPGASRFVIVFVILVITQLSAYRFAIDSRINDGYLFEVSSHTTWVLGWIGHDATLEKEGLPLDPVAVRAQLQLATPPPVDENAPRPLSAWERWQFRAHTLRNSSRHRNPFGPKVSFVLSPGIHYRVQELEAKRQSLTESGPSDVLVEVEASLATLQHDIQNGLQDPELRRQQRGYQFTFDVVPACGAIEVMAIFLAAVLAFPTGWRSRIWGLILGLPILYLVNVARLTCLAVIGAMDNGGPWFTFVHEYVWQAVYIVVVVVLWLIWLEIFVRRRA